MPLLPDVRRIAVLRANGIGDLVFALPALDALRGAYPDAHITLLAAPWHAELLAGRPGPIDEVVVVPVSRGVREVRGRQPDERELESFFAWARGQSFDLALQMHGGGRNSNPFVLGLGARHTAGTRTPDAPALDFDLPYVYYQHEVLRLIETVMLVGARAVPPVPRLEVTEEDLRGARQAVDEPEGLVLLHPSAGDRRRRWPAEKFARTADELAARGERVALVGGPGSEELAASVRACMKSEPLDLTGRIGLSGLLGLLARARLLISNDSGPLHLAGALGTPSVAIYWCGNMINAAQPFRANHRPLLSWRLDCPVCGVDCTKGECPHDESFVADVEQGAVLEAALELLEGGPVLRG